MCIERCDARGREKRAFSYWDIKVGDFAIRKEGGALHEENEQRGVLDFLRHRCT